MVEAVCKSHSASFPPSCFFFFLPLSLSAVYMLLLQEELLLPVLRASGESAHLCHMSLAEGDVFSAAAAHAPTSQGPASVLATP